MEFLNQTYFALRGPAETAQNPQDTVSRLADRLAQSTQLEDRRAALFALRGLSRDYRAQVGASALDSLLLVIDGDALVDQEVAKAVLQTLNTLCEVDGGQESSADQREAALRNTDKVLQDPLHTRKLFGLLNSASFYTRYGTLQLLNTLVTNRHSIVQNHFLNAPENSQTVTAVLEEKRDILRTEGLQLFQALIAQNTDIQTVFAFGGAFESLLRIIAQEGGVEGGVTAYSCLIAIEGLLRYNSSTQTYFRELLPSLPPLLLFPLSISPEQETPQEFALQFWDEAKLKNASLVVGIIGTMKAPEHIRLLMELGIASNAPQSLKAQVLSLLAGYNQTPPLFQTVIPYNPVPNTNDEEWDRLEPCRAVDLLVSTALDGEYGGLGVAAPTGKESMEFRGVALGTFGNFAKDEEVATDILNGMLPTSQQPPVNSTSTLLLTSISTLPSSPLSSQAAVKLQFTCLLFSSLFHGPPNHSSTSPKAIARGLGSTPIATGGDGGNFFVPADGVPSAPEKVPDEDEDEPPSSLLQLLTEHLSLSMLARSKVEDNVIEARLWDKVVVNYLALLCTWLWEDPKGVRIFLEGGGVGVLVEPISQTSGIDVLVQGLCALLFGICYHFNREPGGEITRKTLHSIITRLGADHLIARMARVKDDDRFRHVTPESIVLPSVKGSSGNPDAEIWLDWAFVEFWKSNYYTVQRGVTTDPDALAPGPGDAVELQMVIASLRDVIRKQAEELQAVKAESAQLKKSQQQSAADKAKDVGLEKKLDSLQLERETERTALQKEISDLSSQISEFQEKKKEQEKEQEDLLVFLEEMSEKRKRDKARMRTAGLEGGIDAGMVEFESSLVSSKSMVPKHTIFLANLASRNCYRAAPCRALVSRAFYGHATEPIIHVEKTDVYHYGSVQHSEAIFKDISWTVNPGESWVIVSNSTASRGEIFQILLGRRRMDPVPPKGLFPFLQDPASPIKSSKEVEQDTILHVTFAAKKRVVGGCFTDYTARYGAMRDQDGQTLRESLLESLMNEPLAAPPTEFTPRTSGSSQENQEAVPKVQRDEIEHVASRLHLVPQLDIPMVALSNGQQRRARILRQLIRHPRLLLLEDPFAGLDVVQRPLLANLLGELHSKQQPIVIMELRPQDPLPEWITHVAVAEGQQLNLMERRDYSPHKSHSKITTHPTQVLRAADKEPLMDLKDVRIKYGEREVLRNITWSIRPGDKWWLKGPNGSGKTTLLSLLTGEHPQSYTQAHFHIFGSPRSQTPTVTIQRKVAVFTPEIFAAFPRRLGQGALTVRDAIGTGFENTYSYRPLTVEQTAIREELILRLAPGRTDHERQQWSKRLFAELPPPEQALALFMRTMVSQAPLLILDEMFGGMDDKTIKKCSDYLRENLGQEQAVIFVSHWEHEVPWTDAQKYEIVDGIGQISK